MRYFYIDFLKVIGAFSVVLLHSTAYMMYDVGGERWSEFLIVNSCTRLAVPIFFMCSGAVLIREALSISDLRARLLRLIVPLLFWSCFYEVYLMYTGIDKSIITIIKDICTDKVIYHMWFLYSLIGVCTLLPILSLLCKMEVKSWKYFWCLSFFCTSMKTCANIVNVDFPSKFVMLPLCVIYFCLGYYLSKYKTKINTYKCLGGVSISLLIVILLTYNDSKLFGKYMEFYQSMGCIFILIASVLFFMLCKQLCEKHFKSIRLIINFLAQGTFCCYLAHVAILDCLYTLLFQHNYYQCNYPLAAAVGVATITFMLSCFLGITLQKIPYLRKTV